MWEPGTKLFHKHNPELGVGVVVNVEGRFLDVFFPDAMSRMRLTPDPKSIQPVVFKPGDVVKGPDGIIDAIIEIDGAYAVLMEGDRVEIEQLWPVLSTPSLLERLRDGSLDLHEHVLNRIDGIRLLDFRRQGEMPSLVGGRVELFPHQLDTASRAIKQDRVRWLLADEVGLGKTLIARGIIAKAIDHLWESTERIDIVYICSSVAIAGQNLKKLAPGHGHRALTTRLRMTDAADGRSHFTI